MKRSYVLLLGLFILGFLLAAGSWAAAEDRYARLRHIEGDVVLYPYDKDRPTEAIVNSPVMDGDELETQNGRAEVSFRNGIVVRLGDYSAVRFESAYSPMVIELIGGTVFVDSHLVDRFGDELEVRAGDSQVFLINEGNIRVDLGKQGSVRVTTLDGEAEVRANGSRVLLEANERTYVDPGNQPESPESFARNYDELDDWNQSRIDTYARNDYGSGERYVEDSLYYDSYDLDNYGDWRTYGSYGNVWVPNVGAGWRPYYDGRWMYTGGSYFWVSYEPWGWAPYHYGRWGWNLDFGWYWIPGYTFGPSWVSWYDYGDYIGWCALGYYNYPVYYYDHYGDHDYYGLPHVQKQKTIGVGDSWTFVKKASLGDPSIKRISASGSELKNIQIDKTRVMKQPGKGVSTYVAGKSSNNAKLVKPSQKISAPHTQEKSLQNWTNSEKVRSYGDRDFSERGSASSSTKQSTGSTSQKAIQTPSKSSSSATKGSSSSPSSSGSVKKSTPPSSSSSKKSSTSGSGSSVSKKPSPPNYSRDQQFERYLPESTKLFRDSGSPSQRDREFNTQSYRDRNFELDNYRSLKSDRSYDTGRSAGDEDRLPWFRDPRSYNEQENGNAEVSPRYMEGARKFFERYEASRNTESSRDYSASPRYEPRPTESHPSYGSSSKGSSSGSSVKSYGGGNTRSNSGSAGKSYGGGSTKSAPRSSGSSSVKKPH